MLFSKKQTGCEIVLYLLINEATRSENGYEINTHQADIIIKEDFKVNRYVKIGMRCLFKMEDIFAS